ncbi:Zn-dependent protease [Striga asiatica]|uniref:Zn-dependent protease n=1 Tax=Striga asiatica TaxID=4170 RepID=A0A5A7RBS9_STRAF|nr:Zn-dependent protease [Striga asiatica]
MIGCHVTRRRVVVDSKARVNAAWVSDEVAESGFVGDPQALGRDFEDVTCEVADVADVIIDCTTEGEIKDTTIYSSSPLSPLNPISLQPYPNGLGCLGRARCLSHADFEKNSRPSFSTREITSQEIPWFSTWKNPNSSHAFTTKSHNLGLSRARSITGIPRARAFLLLMGDEEEEDRLRRIRWN